MSRTYRFHDPVYLILPARLEASLAKALGTDALRVRRNSYWYAPPLERPVSIDALAAELRRRGWPAQRADLAARHYRRWYEDLPRSWDRRQQYRGYRRRSKLLIAAERYDDIDGPPRKCRCGW